MAIKVVVKNNNVEKALSIFKRKVKRLRGQYGNKGCCKKY